MEKKICVKYSVVLPDTVVSSWKKVHDKNTELRGNLKNESANSKSQ